MLTHSEKIAAVKDRRQRIELLAASILPALIQVNEDIDRDIVNQVLNAATDIVDRVDKENPMPERP